MILQPYSNHCPHAEHPSMNHGGPSQPASEAATKAQHLQLIALLPDGRSLADMLEEWMSQGR